MIFNSSCNLYSVQECLNSQDVTTPTFQVSDVITAAHARGKLIDHPDAMPLFTIEDVIDYMINRKESDCMQAEDWKSFKAAGYKLFKEAHVQNVLINREETKFEVECRCLPEMKKDRVYDVTVMISTETFIVLILLNAAVRQVGGLMAAVNI